MEDCVCVVSQGSLVPTLLSSQEPAQQSASSAAAQWATRHGPAIAAVEAHRAKTRAKIDKALKDLARREDSSATAFLAAARNGDQHAARAAVQWRERHLATFLADSDTLAVYARELLKWAQRLEDFYRARTIRRCRRPPENTSRNRWITTRS